ncbi:ribonuclease T2 family protein [Phaeovulum sp.]|uniref:ribonuclease T2 family protein n=1 Tax=Phaeovulum sp. TaxID=2934796 RepID=UPI0039E5514E
MRHYLALALMLLASPLSAEGEKAGKFDYYVLSLGWSPTWCSTTGDARKDDQCHPRHDFGFTLHGLWPQYERGWPSYCHTPHRDPTRRQSDAMKDIMGSGGLAWYQWKKHGRCAGIPAADYFATSRQAYDSIVIPDVFRTLHKDVKLPAAIVEEAFLEANPSLAPDMITITCDQGMIQEARICLTKDLTPRPCAPDLQRDCKMTGALMEAIR